ncbi:rhomboid family intramembrane serine protease [Alkalihalobacillus oceani]|uniref:rhomboid family intramembrane serine protease n=1 Tax=Halalkalibacter oceani TaxID=1653776 RepID=UPI00204027E1|nr:rhomboid family intramembrane serine protease [Halalkalibacter oceani]MCM3761692.1 rhomboid family intramembrane serine protease [Halalkalibacter oceani]
MFIRNESFYSFRKQYPVITTLVAIHLILFVWMNFLPFGELILAYGIGFNLDVANGEYWRLVTPIFMHIGMGHVLFNSFSLVIFGPALEQMLGRFKFILTYLLTGIAANIATFWVGGLMYGPHLGASGAIFGLFGLYVYIVLFRKELIDQANAQLVLTIIGLGLVMTFLGTNINIFAHLFGLIAGAALGPIILTGVRPYSAYRQRVYEEGEVAFDPARWQKRQNMRKRLKPIIWTIIILLVVIGLASRLF